MGIFQKDEYRHYIKICVTWKDQVSAHGLVQKAIYLSCHKGENGINIYNDRRQNSSISTPTHIHGELNIKHCQ
jgi:hypothetical protein